MTERTLEYLPYTLGLLTIIAIGGFLYYMWVEHLKKSLIRIKNFTPTKTHIGKYQALAIDFEAFLIGFTDGIQNYTIAAEDFVFGVSDCDLKTNKSGELIKRNHRVTISTNIYELAKFDVFFWTENEAEKCMISLRLFYDSYLSTFKDRAQDRAEIEQISNKIQISSVQNSDIPIPQNVFDAIKLEFEQEAFSPDEKKLPKKQKINRFNQACDIIVEVYCDLMNEADIRRNHHKPLYSLLYPYFLRIEGKEPKTIGYLKGSIKKDFSTNKNLYLKDKYEKLKSKNLR